MDIYFTYDPENNEFETFATLAEQEKSSKEIIASYLENNDEWPEEVTGILSGIITQKATKCDVLNRPEKLDNEGYDEDGQYWSEGIDYICNYEMRRIVK